MTKESKETVKKPLIPGDLDLLETRISGTHKGNSSNQKRPLLICY